MLRKKIIGYGLRVCSPLLLCTCFLISAAWAQAPLQVEWKEGRLSVSAEKVPLAQILQEVARQTGMEIRGLEGLQEPVSVRFARLPLHEGLQKLPVNYLMVWETVPQREPRPVLALVFGRNVPSPPEILPHKALPSAEGTEPGVVEDSQEERLEAQQALTEQGNEEALREARFDDPDPTIQTAAFELLAEQDRQGAIAPLVDATKSDQEEMP